MVELEISLSSVVANEQNAPANNKVAEQSNDREPVGDSVIWYVLSREAQMPEGKKMYLEQKLLRGRTVGEVISHWKQSKEKIERAKTLEGKERTSIEEEIAWNVYLSEGGAYLDTSHGLLHFVECLNYIGFSPSVKKEFILKWLSSKVSGKVISAHELKGAAEALDMSLEQIKSEILERKIAELNKMVFSFLDENSPTFTHFFRILQNYQISLNSSVLYACILEQRKYWGTPSEAEFKERVLQCLNKARTVLKDNKYSLYQIGKFIAYFEKQYTVK